MGQSRSGQVLEVGAEIAIGLAGESDDQVRPERRVRQTAENRGHGPAVVRRRIGTTHPLEHAIAGMLEGQVEVRGESPAARGDQLDDLHSAVHRLERTDPEHQIAAGVLKGAKEVEQGDRRLEIPAVGSQVHACQGDFAETSAGNTPHLADGRVDRHAAARAPASLG